MCGSQYPDHEHEYKQEAADSYPDTNYDDIHPEDYSGK